ncbi:MAG: uroporphyrinogen decarboxylase family protein [Candidatus Bathyarchaeota archaeon]|nr:uroporphyrinogen decarboxylase family protein [Candidatus Bathyarchaeota archaeon]
MSRERILEAIDLEEPDMVPFFDFLYETRSFEKILGRKISTLTPEIIVEGHKALDLDMICAGAGPPEGWKNRRIAPDIEVDEWGIKYRITQELKTLPWYLEGPIKGPEDLEQYQMPDPYASGRLKDLETILKIVGDEMAVAASFPIGGPLTAAGFLTGFDTVLKYVIADPVFADRLLDLQTWYCLEIGKQYLDAGIEIIFLNEDLGDIHGPFMAPKMLRDRVIPYLKRLCDELKKRGARILLHCDGNLNPIMDDLLELGIDGLHPLERKAKMDIGEVKSRYGDRICLIGNVDASVLLPLGSYEEITGQIKECMETGAPGGGYIFASDHSIHPGIPGNKAKFLFRTAKKYRKYPSTKTC